MVSTSRRNYKVSSLGFKVRKSASERDVPAEIRILRQRESVGDKCNVDELYVNE